jgi:hypothetical protein
MKNIFIGALLFAGFSFGAIAQDANTTSDSSITTTLDKYPSWKNRHAIGLSAGLPGYGIEYAYNINRSLNVRAGFLTFTLNDINTDLEVNGQDINVNANLSSGVYELLLEYQPSSNHAFKLVGGFGYLNKVGVNTLVLLNNDIAFGDLSIDNEDIGDIDVSVSWSGMAPYIGFGFGRAVPKKRAGFGIEFGAFYAGGPDVTIDASGMLANTSMEEQELEDNLASYSWMPRIMGRLVFKLGKD